MFWVSFQVYETIAIKGPMTSLKNYVEACQFLESLVKSAKCCL